MKERKRERENEKSKHKRSPGISRKRITAARRARFITTTAGHARRRAHAEARATRLGRYSVSRLRASNLTVEHCRVRVGRANGKKKKKKKKTKTKKITKSRENKNNAKALTRLIVFRTRVLGECIIRGTRRSGTR